jgi:hypothetical protein
VCPFVHSFGSVSKLDSESNPFIRCVALLNEQVYSTNLVFYYCLMLLGPIIMGGKRDVQIVYDQYAKHGVEVPKL